MQRFVGDGFEMVGGGGAEFCGEFGTGAGTKLLGVDAKAQAVLFGGSEDAAGFGDGEGVVVAEGVAVAGKALLCATSGISSSRIQRT